MKHVIRVMQQADGSFTAARAARLESGGVGAWEELSSADTTVEVFVGRGHLYVKLGDYAGLSFAHVKKALLVCFEYNYFGWLRQGAGGNMSKAARMAGVDRTTLYRMQQRAVSQ